MDKDDERRLKKEAIKEAMREWLEDEKKATFESLGKYVAHAFTILIVGAMVWFIMKSQGYHQ